MNKQTIIITALAVLLVTNLISFILMRHDKRCARQGKWRVPEKTLFLLAIIGGSIGAIAGMYLFHHKTRHWYFVIGMPAILVIQIVLAAVVRRWLML